MVKPKALPFLALLPVLFRLAWRNLRRNVWRTLLTALAIAVGSGSSVICAAFSRGVEQQLAEAAIGEITGHIQVHHPEFLSDPAGLHVFSPSRDLRKTLSADPQISAYAERLRIPGVLASERDSRGAEFVGVNLGSDSDFLSLLEAVTSGEPLTETEPDGIIIGEEMAERLQTAVGRRVVLMVVDKENTIRDRGVRIKGLYRAKLDETELAYVFMNQKALRSLLDLEKGISEIAVRLKTRAGEHELLDRFTRAAAGLDVQSWKTLQPMAGTTVELYSYFLLFWYAIVGVATVFGLVNTLFMAILERVKELGLLQALGMPASSLVILISIETFLILIGGSVLGSVSGICATAAFADGIDLSGYAQGMELVGISSRIAPIILIKDVAAANMIIVMLGMLGGLYPAWKVGRLAPVEAISKAHT